VRRRYRLLILKPFDGLGAFIRLGRELHADGGTHFHLFADFQQPFSTRDVRRFDYSDAHPNIEGIRRTPRKAWEYAGKDGDILLDDPAAEPPDTRGGAKRSRDDIWTEICNAADRQSFFATCATLAPRELCCSFTSLRLYADWKYREEQEPYTNPRGFEWNSGSFPDIDEWILESLPEGGDARTGM
jgi:Geminivirus Rep catalytic domain